MLRRRTALTGAAALAATPLAAPALAQGDAARVLKYIPQADVTILDPMVTTAYPTRDHGHMVWDTLYGLDESMQPHPQLAEGHVVEDDGRRWVFTLRQGPTFHDGEPVRAQDAVASIRRWMTRDAHGQTLASRLAETESTRSIPEVIGSGPYRIVPEERVVGSRLVYRRYDRYVPREGTPSMTAGPKRAHFERMEWHVITDAATSAAALQTGEIDWWSTVPNDLRPVLARNRDVNVEVVDTSGLVASLRPNHLHPPFDDPAKRRALLPAINQADFMQSIMGDDRTLWRDGVGCFPVNSPMASDEGIGVLTGPRDTEAAKRALLAAGYKGETVVFLDPANIVNNFNLSQVAIDMMRKCGLTVEDATMDWGTLLQRRARKEPPGQGGWNALIALFAGLDFASPAGHLLLRANGDGAWFGWPNSPALEALRDEWFEAPTLEAQKAIGRRIQAQFWQDLPYWPIGQYFVSSAWRKSLAGVLKGMVLPLNVRRA